MGKPVKYAANHVLLKKHGEKLLKPRRIGVDLVREQLATTPIFSEGKGSSHPMTPIKSKSRSARQRAKEWSFTIGRIVGENLEEDKIVKQIKKIADAVTRTKQHGLTADAQLVKDGESCDDGIQYGVAFTVRKLKVRSEEAADKYFATAKERCLRVADRLGWREVEISPKGEMIMKSRFVPKPVTVRQNLDFGLPELTDEIFSTVFRRIYEREPHIRTIYKAAQTAVRTRFGKRRHVLAYGLPAGAKSEVFSAFMEWFNRDTERVLALDATTTTKAGLELLLLEKAETGDLPPFLYLEEIEKHDIQSLLSLLQVMDHRGKISRNNARSGNVTASAKICIWATCNDYDKLRKFEGGALYSRFNLRLWSSRPSKSLMMKILEREFSEMEIPNTDAIFARKLLDKIILFGYDELGTNDPREFIALLDGWEDIDAYLDDQRKMLAARKRDLDDQKRYLVEADDLERII